jgi:type IV pilus modification protein PilV
MIDLQRSRQSGFTLLEVLIALLVLSIGLLGLAGLQAYSLQNNQSAAYSSHATFLGYDILDRIRANRENAEDYSIAIDDDAPDGTSIAAQDLRAWKTNLGNLLPGIAGSDDLGGSVVITRSRARVTYPARVLLIAATNPCPCGNLGNPVRGCSCRPDAIERYRARLSGPLLDRLDLQLELRPVDRDRLVGPPDGERTAVVAARVAAASRPEAVTVRSQASSPTPIAAANTVPRTTSASWNNTASSLLCPGEETVTTTHR